MAVMVLIDLESVWFVDMGVGFMVTGVHCGSLLSVSVDRLNCISQNYFLYFWLGWVQTGIVVQDLELRSEGGPLCSSCRCCVPPGSRCKRRQHSRFPGTRRQVDLTLSLSFRTQSTPCVRLFCILQNARDNQIPLGTFLCALVYWVRIRALCMLK